MLKFIKIISFTMLIQSSFSSAILLADNNDIPNNNLSSNELFQSAIYLPISYYTPVDKGNYIQKIDRDQAKIQRALIVQAIQRGADLNHLVETQYRHLPLDILYTQKELFFSHLTPSTLVKLILKSDITLLTDPSQIDQMLADQQSELLQLILNQGADLNQILGSWIKSININTLYANKDLLLKEIGPSKFLIMVVHCTIQLNPQHKKLQLELAQLAMDLGADPNFKKNGLSVTMSTSFEHTLELLQLLVDNGAQQCTNSRMLEEIIEAELAHVILDPQFMLDQKYKNLNVSEALEPKMPYILHHIWLTHPWSPREIRDADIANVIATKDTFSKASVQWQHIVWTNDRQLFPESVAQLEQAGIHVKNIYEHQENLKLFKLIETLIGKKQWGEASDTLRVALLEYFGGVYADLNYIFNRDVTLETHKYHFFTSTYNNYYIANFFFGSSPGHPILQKALFLIERNLTTPPAYIANEDQNSPSITYLLTANPIYLAYYSQANKNGNIDVTYPGTSYQRQAKMDHNFSDQTEKTKAKTRASDEASHILKTICPMINLDDYIESNEICATEDHFIGYDSPYGETWVNP